MTTILGAGFRIGILALVMILVCTPVYASPKFTILGVRLGDSLERVKQVIGDNYERIGRERISYQNGDGGNCEITFENNKVICVQVGVLRSKSAKTLHPAWVKLQPNGPQPHGQWTVSYGDSRSYVESKLGRPEETFEVLSTGCVYRKLNLIVSYEQGKVIALALARKGQSP